MPTQRANFLGARAPTATEKLLVAAPSSLLATTVKSNAPCASGVHRKVAPSSSAVVPLWSNSSDGSGHPEIKREKSRIYGRPTCADGTAILLQSGMHGIVRMQSSDHAEDAVPEYALIEM